MRELGRLAAVVSLLSVLGLAGCSAGSEDSAEVEALRQQVQELQAQLDAATSTSTAPATTTSTTTTSTTTTTAAPTNTTAAPTTTTSVEWTPELAAIAFMVSFEEMRSDVIPILEDLSDIESVDKFVTEAADENDILSLEVILDATSTWASPDNQHEGAWEVTRLMSVLYDAGDGAWYDELWTPSFNFTNSGTRYLCAGEFMTQLADARKSMADWEAECG